MLSIFQGVIRGINFPLLFGPLIKPFRGDNTDVFFLCVVFDFFLCLFLLGVIGGNLPSKKKGKCGISSQGERVRKCRTSVIQLD